jgi:outer membrane protein assembly factor BamA
MRFVLPALLVLGLTSANAQTTRSRKPTATTPDNFGLPLLSITVSGNDKVPSATILKIAGIKTGVPPEKEAFETARQRLTDTGFFESIAYRYDPVAKPKPGYAAKFEVKEVTPLYKVQFAGWPGKDKEIADYLSSRDPLYVGEAPPTKALIDRWAGYVSTWAAAQNKPVKVIGKIVSLGNPTGDAAFAIQFQPDQPLPAVARVDFDGNEVFEEPQLQKSIGMVAYGLPYTEQNFLDMLNSQLKPMYEAKGYLRVHFKDISAEPVPPPVKGLLVHVKIVEESQYKLGKVRVSGIEDDDERGAFVHMAALKSGTVANFDAVNQAVEKIKKSIVHEGYYEGTVEAERSINDATKTVDVTFKINRGSLYTFDRLTITGLDMEGETAVRKMWGEKMGDPFNPDYPNHFLAEVKSAGLFDYMGPTKAEVKTDSQAHNADVTLIFLPETQEEKDKRMKKQRRTAGSGPMFTASRFTTSTATGPSR